LVTAEKNTTLLRLVTLEEVDQAIKEMPIGKYPRPDGFTKYFFHHCWNLFREEVWQLIEDSRNYLGVILMLNATFLTLIPKEERVSHLKKY